jgi:hypothetical protein
MGAEGGDTGRKAAVEEHTSSDEMIRQARALLPLASRPATPIQRRRRGSRKSVSELLIEQGRAMVEPDSTTPAVGIIPTTDLAPDSSRRDMAAVPVVEFAPDDLPVASEPVPPRPIRVTRPTPTPPTREDAREHVATARPRSGLPGWLGLAIVGGIAALAIGAIAQTDLGDVTLPEIGSDQPATTVQLDLDLQATLALPIGPVPSCYDLEGPATLESVSCDGLHDYESIGTVVLTAGDYPGADTAGIPAGEACVDQLFEPFVGVEYPVSIWWLHAYAPTTAEWEAGDRLAECVIYQPAADGAGIAPQVGTARDSAE